MSETTNEFTNLNEISIPQILHDVEIVYNCTQIKTGDCTNHSFIGLRHIEIDQTSSDEERQIERQKIIKNEHLSFYHGLIYFLQYIYESGYKPRQPDGMIHPYYFADSQSFIQWFYDTTKDISDITYKTLPECIDSFKNDPFYCDKNLVTIMSDIIHVHKSIDPSFHFDNELSSIKIVNLFYLHSHLSPFKNNSLGVIERVLSPFHDSVTDDGVVSHELFKENIRYNQRKYACTRFLNDHTLEKEMCGKYVTNTDEDLIQTEREIGYKLLFVQPPTDESLESYETTKEELQNYFRQQGTFEKSELCKYCGKDSVHCDEGMCSD